MSDKSAPGVLSGIRVLDFAKYVAGPYCATLLGFLGAEVIRVERPGGSEDRGIAPMTEGAGAVFMQTAANKQSVCLRLGDERSRDVVARLVASADVVVTNFPPAAQRRFGLDLETLRGFRDDIILANASSFGENGPLADQGGFDGIGQAMSGAMYMTGLPGAPAKAAAPYVDYSSAVLLAFGVMAALRERDQTGRGQAVSGNLLSTALAVFNSHLVEQSVLSCDRAPSGNRVQTSAPSDAFATTDGHILVHCPGDGVFRRWLALLGHEDWAHDARFASDQARGDARDTLCEAMQGWCATRDTETALAELRAAGVPAGPVLNLREALAHPQTAAVDVLNPVAYPGLAREAMVADLPVKMSESNTGIRARPPTPGEHTNDVLAALGYSAAELAALRNEGVIA